MARIDRSSDNLYDWPKGAYIRNKRYLYINTSNRYVSPDEKQEKGTRGYTDHDSICIGVVEDPDHPEKRKFYANMGYLAILKPSELPEPPMFSDSLTVGLTAWIRVASNQSGLTEDLSSVFGEEDTQLILDLAAYMLSKESAVMQHFPAWAREHELFSSEIRDDNYIGQFLKKNLTISKIKQFREYWAVRNIGDGMIFLCYDSTNVNSQAEGVFIVQRGHAKDNPELNQVNTDYVIRQSDGLPLTYLHSPGSVTDIAQASEMLRFIARLKELSNKDVQLCLICDRGYISETNLRHMDNEHIEYILMLRTTFREYDRLAELAIDKIRSYKNEIRNSWNEERYGLTTECILYKDGPSCYAQILWSAERYQNKRNGVKQIVESERSRLQAFIDENKGKSLIQSEIKDLPFYFKLKTEAGEPRIVEKKKRGRGGGTEQKEINTVRITGYEDDETAINRLYQKAGIAIIMTSAKMTAQETNDYYSKRDCVEKTFQALKSHLGMDKIGVTTEEAMHGKGLVWFVASILHAILFNKTSALRTTERKCFTVPAMIDQLEAIKADKNLSTGKRERRYKLTSKQKQILNFWDLDEVQIDQKIASISE